MEKRGESRERRECSLSVRGRTYEAQGKLHQRWCSLHVQILSCLTDVQKNPIGIYLESVVERGVKGVSRIRRSLSEACVGVVS